MEKGFIRNDLDWDVKKGNFTLRLFGADNTPLKAITIRFKLNGTMQMSKDK